MKNNLRFRQIHMDFHTADSIPVLGEDFDPEEFARILKEAHVDSITCFARCHHGWFYYDSIHFPERVHPNLQDKNLLKKQIEACHKQDIKVPIYTTVQWDEQIAKEHREWLVINPDGAPFGQPEFKPGFYRNFCLNTGYVEYLKEQVQDMLECLGEVDGVFLDILNLKPCCCPTCVAEMRQKGLNAEDETVRYEFAQTVMDRFKEDMTSFIHNLQKNCPVFYNVGAITSRHRKALNSFTHLEIESLPGGQWGYDHFPVTARYTRTLGLDFMGMTGKFHTDWGDFSSLRNKEALSYECFKSLAYGGKCSIGDQLHPSGKISKAAYDLVGKVYEQVEEKEPWCVDATPVVEAAVLIPEEFLRAGTPLVTDDLSGAVKLLTQVGMQFNVIDTKEDFSLYKLLILPDNIPLVGELEKKLDVFLQKGGKLLASYRSGLVEDKDFAAFMPISYVGEAPYSPDFVPAYGELAKGLYEGTEYVMYNKAVKVSLREGAKEELVTNVPYENRTWEHYCSHRHYPSSGKYGYPAAAREQGIIYFAHPVFTIYQEYGCKWVKTLVKNAILSLMGQPLVCYEGPSPLEMDLNEQKYLGREILHCLHYIPERRTSQLDIIEDVIPLYKVPVSLDLRGKTPVSVRMVPQCDELTYEVENGRMEVVIPVIEGHQMVEIQYVP